LGLVSCSDATEDDSSAMEADERTSLLPPPGISTFEQRDRSSYTESGRRSSRRGKSSKQGAGSQRQYSDRSGRYGGSSRLIAHLDEKTERWDNRTGPLAEEIVSFKSVLLYFIRPFDCITDFVSLPWIIAHNDTGHPPKEVTEKATETEQQESTRGW
jgi:hypothetical protein